MAAPSAERHLPRTKWCDFRRGWRETHGSFLWSPMNPIPNLLLALQSCPLSEVDGLRMILADALEGEERYEEAEWVRANRRANLSGFRFAGHYDETHQYIHSPCPCMDDNPPEQTAFRENPFAAIEDSIHKRVAALATILATKIPIEDCVAWVGQCRNCNKWAWATNAEKRPAEFALSLELIRGETLLKLGTGCPQKAPPSSARTSLSYE
jgi:hypothetical protein